jgi:hypothetical protein
VLYSDNAGTAKGSHTKGTEDDLVINLNMNGNTVKAINSESGSALTVNSDYIIETNLITFKNNFLESLDLGVYDLTVAWNPLGMTGTTEEPTETIITIIITNEKTYSVTVNVNPIKGGMVSTSTLKTTTGDTVTLQYAESNGYTFSDWVVNSGDITISNNSFVMGTSDVVITANFDAKDIKFNSTWLPIGKIGEVYDQTINEATGGSGYFTYEITDGKLPLGLTLNGLTISGTPSTNESSRFTLTATDNVTELEKSIELSILILELDGENVYEIFKHFGVWTGSGSVNARIDADYNQFVRLILDGKVINPSHYRITEGSTIITLNEEYLSTLDNGVYLFKAEFLGGISEEITLTIDKNGPTPTTPATTTEPALPENPNTTVEPRKEDDEPKPKDNEKTPKTGVKFGVVSVIISGFAILLSRKWKKKND